MDLLGLIVFVLIILLVLAALIIPQVRRDENQSSS